MAGTTESWTEEFKVTSENLLNEIKRLIEEGTARHIVIKDEQGNVKHEFPLAFGVAGVLLMPVFAAIAGLAVIASDYTIAVRHEKTVESEAAPEPPPPAAPEAKA